jgi:DNA-directed RNA polymerase I subunit RPA1
MATHRQYIVPTSGKPIRGLIQDSVVSGVFMSSKDTFLTKDQYQQLVYVGLRELLEDGKLNKIITMPPTIIKPHPLWTGKQVVSTLLKNIVNHEGSDYKKNKIQGLNLDSKSKLSAKEWGEIGKEEGDVIFRDNELLQGTLDKNQYGASEFGLVHSFYEIYGSEKAGELLTSLARIFTAFLQMHGFTCGLDDLVLTPEFNKKRRLIIEESHQSGMQAAAKFSDLGDDFKADPLNYSNRIVFQSERRPRDKDIERFNRQAMPENPFEGKKCIQADNPVRTALEAKFNLSEDL